MHGGERGVNGRVVGAIAYRRQPTTMRPTTMGAIIRLATPDDAAGILAIYAPIVEQTATSFEEVAPTLDEMKKRIADTLEAYPG